MIKRRKLKLKLYRPFLDRIDLSPRQLKHLLGAATEAQRLSQDGTVYLETFADEIFKKKLRNYSNHELAFVDVGKWVGYGLINRT